MQVRFVCAAAPSHPLHGLGREITFEQLCRQCHLMVRDSGTLRSRSGGWLNERRWTVSNKATSIRAACMGLGYAWYPEENIREELDAGRIPDTLGSTDKALGSNWRPGSTSDGGGTASGGLT